jgi:hypothetical protein
VAAFDLSMILKAAKTQADQRIVGPLHVQFVMGMRDAMPVARGVFEFYVETPTRRGKRRHFSRARGCRAEGARVALRVQPWRSSSGRVRRWWGKLRGLSSRTVNCQTAH